MTGVLVIDDHPILLQGARRVLEDALIGPVFEAGHIVAGYRTYRRNDPEVVVVDLAMHGQELGGMTLIRRIRSHDPRARIVVFSMHRNPAIVFRALEAGASGYLLKDTSPDELTKAVQQVRAGVPYLSRELAVEVALLRRTGKIDPLSELTPRELQTLTLLACGKTYSRIADELRISYKTVANVSYQLRQKLGAGNMPELIRSAVTLLASRA
jgi:two-component system invasion response regulator UvrY